MKIKIKNNKKDMLGKKGFYLLPNIFTTASLFAGFYAIVQAMNGAFDHSAIAIFIALILDGLDGRVARLTNTESDFGAEYDSLSDMVSFGAAPALVIYVWALNPLGKFGWIIAFIYCTCASGKNLNFRKSQPFIAILIIVIIFGVISHNPAEIVFLIALLYALSGPYSYLQSKKLSNYINF